MMAEQSQVPAGDEDEEDFLDDPEVKFETKSMLDLDRDYFLDRVRSEFTQDDWDWVD